MGVHTVLAGGPTAEYGLPRVGGAWVPPTRSVSAWAMVAVKRVAVKMQIAKPRSIELTTANYPAKDQTKATLAVQAYGGQYRGEGCFGAKAWAIQWMATQSAG